MIAEQRLINQIKDFVNGLEQEPSTNEHDLADQFAGLCRSFNERMAKCGELLEKGLRSEAVQEALSPPSLFQLRELLEAPEIRKWRNMCLDFGMTPPPEFDFDTVDRLQEECSTEQFLQPLLRKFRRLVHEGTREERIRILRQLRVHDRGNPVWVENLEPLERQQLQEIDKKADQAIKDDDIETLRELYEDLTDPRRLVSPPDEVVEKVEARLREERGREAVAEGQELIRNLSTAHEAEDFEQVEKLVGKWRRLSRFADFYPTDNMEKVAGEAARWLEREKKRREKERRYQEALDKLRSALDRPRVDSVTLEQAWDQVRSFNKPLPPGLAESVPERIEMLRAEELRRRRKKRTFITLSVLLLTAVAGASGWWGWRTLQLKRHTERLQNLWTQKETGEVERYLERLQAESPGLYQTPRIQLYQSNLRDYKQSEAERQEEFSVVMRRLQEIKAASYDTTSLTRIRSLIQEAQSLAATTAEERRVESWEQGWRLWRERRQTERNEAFTQIRTDLQSVMASLENADDDLSLAEMESKIEQAAALVEQGNDLLSRVPAEIRQGWGPLAEEAARWRTTLAARQARLEAARKERREFLVSLDEELASLGSYKQALTEFLAEYPDVAEAEDFQRVLDRLPANRDALALNDTELPDLPVNSEATAPFKETRDLLGAEEGSLWYKDLTVCIDYGNRADAVRREISGLRTLRFWDWKVIRFRRKGAEDWQRAYYPDTFFRREQTTADGDPYTLYWGEVFQTSPETYKPWLDRIRLDSREYEVEWDERPSHNLIPAARYARRLVDSIPDDQYVDDWLLRRIEELINNEEIAVAARAELIERLIKLAGSAIPFGGSGIAGIQKTFDDLNTGVPWINSAHSEVRDEVQQIEAALGTLSAAQAGKVRRTLEFDRWLLKATLNRKIRIAGVVKKDLDTGRLYPEARRMNGTELYCVLPGRQGVAHKLYVAARLADDGTYSFHNAARDRAFTGQVLLAPVDGKASPEFMAEGPHSPDDIPAIDWPAAWPLKFNGGSNR